MLESDACGTIVAVVALVTGTVAQFCANMFVWTISNVVNVGAVLCIRYYHVHYVSDGTFNAGYGPRRCFWTFRRNSAQDTGFFHKVQISDVRSIPTQHRFQHSTVI